MATIYILVLYAQTRTIYSLYLHIVKYAYCRIVTLMTYRRRRRRNGHDTYDINEARPNLRFYMFPLQKLASSVDLSIWMSPIIHQDDAKTWYYTN